MARNFVAASSENIVQEVASVAAAPVSISYWFRTASVVADQGAVFIADKDTTNNYIGSYIATDSTIRAVTRSSATNLSASKSGVATNTWQQAGAVFASVSSRIAYLNGVAGTAETTSITPGAFNRTGIGSFVDSTPSNYMNGYLAEVAIWNVALKASDMLMLSKGYSPLFVQKENLVFYAPLIRNLTDLTKPNVLTASGTTVFPHIRIIYPRGFK